MIDAIYHYFLSSNMRGGEKIKGIKCNSKKLNSGKFFLIFYGYPLGKKLRLIAEIHGFALLVSRSEPSRSSCSYAQFFFIF